MLRSQGPFSHFPRRVLRASATLNPIDWDHYFADFDDDGAADYVRFKRNNSNPKIYSTPAPRRGIKPATLWRRSPTA